MRRMILGKSPTLDPFVAVDFILYQSAEHHAVPCNMRVRIGVHVAVQVGVHVAVHLCVSVGVHTYIWPAVVE